MIVGVVGTLSAGKTTVAHIIEEQGFKSVSLSTFLRECARLRGLKEDRDTLYSIANEHRAKYGPAALMDEALNRIDQDPGDYVVDAIRNIAEVRLLSSRPDVHIIGVDADLDVRFARALARQATTGRQENASSKEEFAKRDMREHSDDPNRPQLREVLKEADIVIMNDGTPEELKAAVLKALASFKAHDLPRGGEP